MNIIKRHQNNKYLRFFSSILVGIIILLCTIYIFAYSYGFRLTLDRDQPIEKTGVLSIDSVPFFADVYLNDKLLGKTPKTTGSISEGIYTVSVKKDGYKDWQKVLPIEGQRSTPFTSYLFFNEPRYESEYKVDAIGDYKISPDKSHIFIPTITTDTNGATDTNKFFTIIDYKINRVFWDFSANPTIVFKAPYTSNSSYEIQPSEIGSNLLVYKYLTNADNKKTLEIILLRSLKSYH
jgi:hypothetical protein